MNVVDTYLSVVGTVAVHVVVNAVVAAAENAAVIDLKRPPSGPSLYEPDVGLFFLNHVMREEL